MTGTKETAALVRIKNVDRLAVLVEKSLDRSRRCERMACFSGWSGYGKSTAAAYSRQKFGAYYVEARATWTKKTMLQVLYKAVGAGVPSPRMNATQLAEEAAWRLASSGRALIIDEFDRIVGASDPQNEKSSLIAVIRDIYMMADRAPIIIVGEEALPAKLDAHERFVGRVAAWGQAEPLDLEDARALANLYVPNIKPANDLLDSMIGVLAGSARRIIAALYDVADFAAAEGLDAVALADWGGRPWTAGGRPVVRAVGQRGASV